MKRKIRIQRGSQDDLRLEEFDVEVEPGMGIRIVPVSRAKA